MKQARKVLVVGATGGSGRAAVARLLEAGYFVTAFSRHANQLEGLSDRLVTVNGDATNPADIDRAVAGQDAVIVTLGITENPLRVRLFGTSRTPLDVRSQGTRAVISAMRRHNVRRLVVQSTYGVGKTRGHLRLIERLFFGLLLKPQIVDTEAQELVVKDSEMEWVLAQPVHLTDEEIAVEPFTSADGEVRQWKVSRQSVAHFLVAAVSVPEYVGQSFAVSG